MVMSDPTDPHPDAVGIGEPDGAAVLQRVPDDAHGRELREYSVNVEVGNPDLKVILRGGGYESQARGADKKPGRAVFGRFPEQPPIERPRGCDIGTCQTQMSQSSGLEHRLACAPGRWGHENGISHDSG